MKITIERTTVEFGVSSVVIETPGDKLSLTQICITLIKPALKALGYDQEEIDQIWR